MAAIPTPAEFGQMCLEPVPLGTGPHWARVCSLPSGHDGPHIAFRNHRSDREFFGFPDTVPNEVKA